MSLKGRTSFWFQRNGIIRPAPARQSCTDGLLRFCWWAQE